MSLSVHPTTNVAVSSSDEARVVVIGVPVDLENSTVENRYIARNIIDKIGSEGTVGIKALKYVSYLGGRFICILYMQRQKQLTIITDCVASYPVYWTKDDSGAFLASTHASLCGTVANRGKDPESAQLIKTAQNMNTRGTLFPPGTMTGYKNVAQVLPNHYLQVEDSIVKHQRYYPFSDTTLETNTGLAYQTFKSTFSLHSKLLSQLGTIGISLTGGRDSRATLAAILPHINDAAFTWTYRNSKNPHPEHTADNNAARELANSANLRHLEVDLGGDPDPYFEKAYRTTMGATAQMPRVPLAYQAQLPEDIVELQSMAAEVGTGFYKRREGPADLSRLCQLYVRGDFGQMPEVKMAIQRFIDYAEFLPERFGQLDYHDLFYWEHRLGRWGSRRIQEVDLAHRVVLPFNSRSIIEALMAPPIAQRSEKQFLVRFVSETQPELEI